MPGWQAQDGYWWCNQCQDEFFNYQEVVDHFESSQAHSWCRQCDRDFSSDAARQSHYVNSSAHAYCTLCHSLYHSHADLHTHQQSAHAPCTKCNNIFNTKEGLHEHARQSHTALYCAGCRRFFDTAQNLTAHLGSSIHTPANIPCPSTRFGSSCPRFFVSTAAAVLHLESGTCSSGMNRQGVDRFVTERDNHNVLTNPNQRLLGYVQDAPQPSYAASERSWNPYRQSYQCLLCNGSTPRFFKNIHALNQHLGSSVHLYSNQGNADKLYRCSGCQGHFSLFSALVQHMENTECRERVFQLAQSVVGTLMVGY